MFKQTTLAMLVASTLFSVNLTAADLSASLALVNETPAVENSQKPFPLSKNINTGVLKNGMKYIISPNTQAGKKVSLQLVVHSGSLDEADDQLGIAHLVEHMAFNGTKDFPNNQLIEHAESLGLIFGRDLNAMTEMLSTSYYFHLPSHEQKRLNAAMHMLSQQAFYQVFDAAELEKERPVVEEEWRRSRGMLARLGLATNNIMLGNSLYARRNPIGDMELVRHVSAKRIEDFWRTWYQPNNMTLIAVGDISEAELAPLLDKYFANVPFKALPKRAERNFALPQKLTAQQITDPEIVTEVVSMSFLGKQPQALNMASLRQELINTLAMDMLRKRLGERYQVEGEYLSRVVAGDQSLIPDHNNNRVMGIVKDKNFSKAYQELFDNISLFKQHGFSNADLLVVKADLMQLQERVLQQLEKPTNSQILRALFSKVRLKQPLFDTSAKAKAAKEILANITLLDVNQYFKKMIDERSAIAIAQINEKNIALLPKALEVEAMWQQSLAKPQAMEQELTEVKPLFTQTLAPIAPSAYQQIRDIHIWHFPNGASVWFEPSDKSKQNLILSWQGAGGSKHLDEKLLRAAQLSGNTMASFGFAGLSRPEVDTANAGKTVRIMAYVDSLEHGITGSTITSDLEIWLQNMYQMMLKPQVDKEIWQSRKNRLIKILGEEIKSAELQYDQAIAKISYANDKSLLPMTVDEISAISEQDLLQVWQQFFSHAAGRQLVIVGNIEPEKVKALASVYIANLPKGNAYPDMIIPKLWSGKHQVNINAGLEPKGSSGLYFNLDYPFSLNAERQASLVSRIIRTRLMEAIREQASGTYSPSFSIKLDRERQQIYGNLSYSHEPSRSEELMKIAQGVIADLISNGITQAELDTVKEQQRNSYKADNISDKLRFGWLRNNARENQVLDNAKDYLEWLENIQVHQLNALITKVLSAENQINARMSPAIAKVDIK